MPDSQASSRHPPGSRIAVLLPLPLDTAYDYRVPEGLELEDGDFVRVPLGARRATGVVWGPGTGEVGEDRLKPVDSRLDTPPLPQAVRGLVAWTAGYCLAPLGAVLRMAMSVPGALEAPRPEAVCVLAETLPGLRLTDARRRVLAAIADGPPRSPSEVAREAAVSPSVVSGLMRAGALATDWVTPVPVLDPPRLDLPGPRLTTAQSSAAKALRRAMVGGFGVTLLDGIPGSGKTEVYFEAAAEALARGGQVLVMLPEIALGAQWLARFRARFGVEPVAWHSDLTGAQRRVAWRAVAHGRARVVVGARSALFLPFAELALIVLDEEHDAAFKQEDGVIYNARDMAVVRGRLEGIPVVLVSATPSLETVANVEDGRYARLHLPERHTGGPRPAIEVVDMKRETMPAGRWLSGTLRAAIAETIAAGEQGLLFLNRRGYAPLTLCKACGHRMQCPRCTAWLVEHRLLGRLQCHHCGYGTRLPQVCPACEAADALVPCGPGVERVAEEVNTAFPGIRYEIAASDTVYGPRAAAALVRRIEDHELDLVIGTQIVAKGYHFPNLTLVGVVDADIGLSGGDLRAAERTFQLLFQVAGRAGRAARPGRVFLQTYDPGHPVMAAVASGDRDRFVEAESDSRRLHAMPPYGRLVALIVSGRNPRTVEETARALGRSAPRAAGVEVFGPAPAPLAMLRGRHRQRLLLKAPRTLRVQPLTKRWLASVTVPGNVRVQVDVDPYSFF